MNNAEIAQFMKFQVPRYKSLHFPDKFYWFTIGINIEKNSQIITVALCTLL